jgi:hypothetical protein
VNQNVNRVCVCVGADHFVKKKLRLRQGNLIFTVFLQVSWDCVHLVRRPLFGIFYQPRMKDYESEATGGMSSRRNSNTQRKPASVPLCPTQIPHTLTQVQTRVAAVGDC